MLLMILGGCGRAERAAAGDGDGRPVVVATTGMIGDVAKQIAGERMEVVVLMGPGVDPHLYRPTRRDMQRLLAADLVLYNGLHLEGRMIETFQRLQRDGRRTLAVTERIDPEYLLVPAEYEGAFDPHVWMDVGGWMVVTEAIAAALAELDPDGAEVYRNRAAAYRVELEALDAWAREAIAGIPEEQRVLVTAHDAFGYFARAYGIEVLAIQGISTDSEAGLRRIEQMVDRIVTRRIAAVFTETSVADKNVLALIDGARARGHEVRLGGELFSDAMGREGTYEGTYIGMIDHNVTTIAGALGGEVPQRGPRVRMDRQSNRR